MTKPEVLDALQDPYPPLKESDIRSVEQELGLQLPGDYAQFLLKRNGGYFQHTAVYVSERPLPSWSSGQVELRKVFAITDDNTEYNDMRYHSHLTHFFDPTIPRNFIPFAETSWQDYFCLVGSGPEIGKVYYWGREETSNHFVARSFTEFMQRVRLVEDQTWNLPDPEADTIPVFQAIRAGDVDAVRGYLARGGDVNLRTKRGTTLLMYSAHARWPTILELVLSHKPDVHARDCDGRDAIWYVVAAQSLEGTRLVLAAGGNPLSRDNNDEALLDIPVGDRLYNLLEEHGAKPCAKKPDKQ